ncbi:MAG: sensor histidine kinase, partial [Thermotogae bacterium]
MFSSLRWKMVAGQTLLLSLLLGLSLIIAYNGVKMMHVARSANLLRQSVSAALKSPLMMKGVILPGGVAIIDEDGNVVVGFFDTKREGFDSFLRTVLSTKNVGFAKLGEEEYLVVVAEKAMTARGPEKYYLLQPAGGITVLL